MKQRTILSTLLLCVLLLAGCGAAAQTPDATPTPAPEAAATPTPDARPAEHSAVYGRATLRRGLPRLSGPDGSGFLPADVFWRQGAAGAPHLGWGLLSHHPRDSSATVRLYKNDMETDAKTLFYEQTNGDAFVIGCNVSDIFPDVTVSITSGGETVDFSPFISLKDGSVQVGERGLDITRISTSS